MYIDCTDYRHTEKYLLYKVIKIFVMLVTEYVTHAIRSDLAQIKTYQLTTYYVVVEAIMFLWLASPPPTGCHNWTASLLHLCTLLSFESVAAPLDIRLQTSICLVHLVQRSVFFRSLCYGKLIIPTWIRPGLLRCRRIMH